MLNIMQLEVFKYQYFISPKKSWLWKIFEQNLNKSASSLS